MEEIKAPKKERKFLKAVGNIAKVLVNELVMGIARKFIGKAIDKVGNKKQGLVIAFLLVAGISYASMDSIPYPITGNKQRLGWQTSGNGLVWRGRATDTITKPTSYADKNVKAYLILDSVSGSLYVFKQGSWAAISGAGGGLTMPFDSITFNTAKDGTVGVGEVEYNDTQGSLIQGLKGGLVTNVIGQQLHQRVNNRTGATLAKGDVVYLSGSQGNRITVAKALGVTDAFSANTFGIVAESIANNQSGYIITEGLITGINTSSLVEDSAVYLSPTVAGGLTSTKPQAPQHTVYIGVCVKSNAGSGELFVKIRNGQELDELHDVRITSPVNNASLYYKSSEGIWRDTTAALLVSDTASMLANYATKAYADTSGRFYARQDFRNVSSSTLTWTQTDTLVVNDTTSLQVYRNGQILLPSQYTVPTNASVVIGSTAYKIGENYTVILPRGGGGGSGSGSLTSISGGTGITVSPNPITTTGTVSADLSVLMELTDTTLLNLTTRFATKQNNITLTTTGTSGAATLTGATLNIPQYTGGSGTVTSVGSGYGLLGGPITTTGTLRVDTSTVYDFVRDSIVAVEIGGDTIKIIKQEYENVTSDTLTFTILPKFPIQLRQFILLFRNGQLLLNDQFTVIDTNKVKVASTSFKVGENYTLVTVSGIGSVSSGQGNPIYPEAGIALSTGTTWTTSITNNSSNWNTAYTDRLKWDGGSTGLVAATGRTSLGGTTIGQSMFTLTNPSAITFPQFNADNSVSALSAASFRSAIGGGTVTSVTAAAGTPISITNNTTTPELSINAASASVPGYLLSADWTTFNNKFAFSDTTSLNLTTRFASKQNNLTLTTTGTSGAATLVGSTLNIPQYSGGGGGSGTVTSVGLTAPSIFTVSGSPVTTSGTLALTYSGTALPLLNGGTGATTADAALTNLGVTTVGKALLVADNSVSDKFIKVNANKTITLLTAADTRTALGATVRGANTFLLADLGAISFLRYNADNTVSQRAADGMRTDLGGTTIGQSIFTLTNPSAITFPRFNVDNSVTALSATDFRTAIGGGTVTSVTASGTSGNPLSITNTTTTPVIELLSATTSRNGYLTSTDWTTFNNKFAFSDTTSLNLTTRFASKQNNLTLTTTGTSGAATLVGATLNIPQYSGGGGGSGTVTSVGLSAPSIFTVSGSPVTTSGTLALTYSGNALPLANGGTGATDAANARITLGGTTSGISLFTLTNSVSDKFIKVNSNNTITLLSAADTRTTIGAGTGSVTSVAMSVPTFLSVSGSPVTSSGTLAVSLSGVPLPVLNGGTGGANETDARNQLGAACKSCTETLTGNKTFSGTVTTSNLTGTANAIVGKTSSNVLTTLTSVNQSGIMGIGIDGNTNTDANGRITINHGLSFTPTVVFANITDSSNRIINVYSQSSTQIIFQIRYADTGLVASSAYVSPFYWLALK
jgi:hypothetical protein